MLYRGQLLAAYAKVRHKKFARRAYSTMLHAGVEYRGRAFDWPDRQVMVWSDLHLGHERVIEYAERPFLDADDMDSELWGAWADDVGRDDVLVCVGDLAMGPARNEATWTYMGTRTSTCGRDRGTSTSRSSNSTIGRSRCSGCADWRATWLPTRVRPGRRRWS